MKGTAAGEGRGRPRAHRSYRRAVGVGLFLSVVIHVALAALVAFPRSALVVSVPAEWELRQVEVPPLIDVPEAPEVIRQPSRPEVSSVEVAEATAASGDPDPPAVDEPVPEPPRVTAATFGERPALAPPDVRPSLEAADHFRKRLERSYPRMLRDRGVGGVVVLEFFVDPRGDVSRVEVAESSGHGVLDQVAERMANEMRFLPALNRDRAVGVWVSQRICFVTVEDREENPSPAECEHLVTLGGR